MSNVSRSPLNYLGRDVTDRIPARDNVPGMISMGERDALIWQLATPYLQTRDNDAHTLYSYGIARSLLTRIPGANENIVLPAIILHDTGWSTIDENEAFQAIAPDRDGSLHHVVIKHEKEGARIAREVLTEAGIPEEDIVEICAIIDGHDTRLTSISLNDSLVKDSDKIWRVSPHGVDVAMPRFGLDREESVRINGFRAYEVLFTDEGKAMSLALMSIECMNLSSQMANCYVREDN